MRIYHVRVHTRESGSVVLTVLAHDDYEARHAAAKRFDHIGTISGTSAYSTEVLGWIKEAKAQ